MPTSSQHEDIADVGGPDEGVGNLLLAGHLTWWASRKPSSSHLGELRPGDSIVLRDAERTAFTYAVAWARQESALEPSAGEVWG